jgi:hypothetical protein
MPRSSAAGLFTYQSQISKSLKLDQSWSTCNLACNGKIEGEPAILGFPKLLTELFSIRMGLVQAMFQVGSVQL